jgi:hypothetical protein
MNSGIALVFMRDLTEVDPILEQLIQATSAVRCTAILPT